MNHSSKTDTINRGLKIAVYGAMGISGTTFCTSAANADICYTDLTGNELVFTSTSPIGIDMDQDGNDDFTFQLGTFGPNQFGSNSWIMYFSAATGAPDANRVAINGNGGASNIAAGESISSRNFGFSFGYMQFAYTSYNPGNVYGSWLDGANGHLAVQFEDGTGATRFGWIEASVTGDVSNGDFSDLAVTISGFAFAKDVSITAGQTAVPEPTSLGLLALGGAGLMARRRRQNVA